MPLPPEIIALRCDNCGARPETLFAKVGESHYKRVEHGAGIPGNRNGTKLRTCGKWRSREPGEDDE